MRALCGSFQREKQMDARETYKVAGIDVHKKMLAVVVADVAGEGQYQFERRQFGATHVALQALAEWLVQQRVEEVVMTYASHCTSVGR